MPAQSARSSANGPDKRRRLARRTLYLAPAIFLLAVAGLLSGLGPAGQYFYLLAWWPLLLFGEAAAFMRGDTEGLFGAPGHYALLLPLSVAAWLLFEALNLRLENWSYHGLPESAWLRWPGYVLSFATVLPAVLLGERLFLGLPRIAGLSGPRLPLPSDGALSAAGATCLLLPLLLPRLFFPLVWLAFIPLLDPFLRRSGGYSPFGAAASGSYGRIVALLCSGLFCGLVWEGLNFWASAKWHYHLPYLNQPRLFEMPLAGFLGFLPFAVECRMLADAFLLQTRNWRTRGARGRLAAACIGLALGSLLVLAGLDALTRVPSGP